MCLTVVSSFSDTTGVSTIDHSFKTNSRCTSLLHIAPYMGIIDPQDSKVMPRFRHSMMSYSVDVRKRTFLKNSTAIWHILTIFGTCKKLSKLTLVCVIRYIFPHKHEMSTFLCYSYSRLTKYVGIIHVDSKVGDRSASAFKIGGKMPSLRPASDVDTIITTDRSHVATVCIRC